MIFCELTSESVTITPDGKLNSILNNDSHKESY